MDLTDVTPEAVNAWVAKELFGWRWMSFIGVPVRGTEGYPAKRWVRAFVSPSTQKQWAESSIRNKSEIRAACGDEPLSYSYCSSQGGEFHPNYLTDANADALVRAKVRGMDKFLHVCSARNKLAKSRVYPKETMYPEAFNETGDWTLAAFAVAHNMNVVELSKHLGREG